MNPASLSIAVICVLSFYAVKYATGCGERQTKLDGRCCDLCPPGTYVAEFCSEGQKTVCNPCAEGYFSDSYNIFDRCEECQSCPQEYAQKCTPTTNANCSGFLCSDNVCSNCEENKCVIGEKPKSADDHKNGSYSIQIIIGIGFLLLSVSLTAFRCSACIKKLKKNKEQNHVDTVTFSNNNGDFHLSKEESGIQLIIQDEPKSIDSFGQLHLDKVLTA